MVPREDRDAFEGPVGLETIGPGHAGRRWCLEQAQASDDSDGSQTRLPLSSRSCGLTAISQAIVCVAAIVFAAFVLAALVAASIILTAFDRCLLLLHLPQLH